MKYYIEIAEKNDVRRIEVATGMTYILGRKPEGDNTIEFTDRSVSAKHAFLRIEGDGMEITDAGSTNGTYVRDERISQPTRCLFDEEIKLGRVAVKVIVESSKTESKFERALETPAETTEKEEFFTSEDEQYFNIKRMINQRLYEKIDFNKLILEGADLTAVLSEKADETIDEMTSQIPSQISKAKLKKDIIDDATGLGPLEPYLADESVTEIMVLDAEKIYIERGGKTQRATVRFYDDDQILRIINRIVSPLGKTINESTPYVDARLADGSRVHAIIPPCAISGPTLTIRKFGKKRFTAQKLVTFGSIAPRMLDFLKLSVENRKNIIISGGTGTGKTTMLNIVSLFIPERERVITVEDSAELWLRHSHWVRLESRPANIEGRGEITIRDMVKNTLRMRPDRIIVGECRGPEALDMLNAMNTGHDGSLTTIHSNSPRDMLLRLETLVLMADTGLPHSAIMKLIASAIDLVIQISRFPDGTRKVTEITEISGIEGDVVLMQPIFKFTHKGFDGDGNVIGYFESTGNVPNFCQTLRESGIQIPFEIFEPGEIPWEE